MPGVFQKDNNIRLKSTKQLFRQSHGMTLTEMVAALSLMMPVLTTSALVIAEVSQAYFIKQGLMQAAREAARSMQAIYKESHIISNNRALQDSLVYNQIRISNIVANSSQFTTAVFNPTSQPPQVTVSVQYTSGQNGLAKFPTFDPLNLGANYRLNASATYALY